jgi:hypothetical protein
MPVVDNLALSKLGIHGFAPVSGQCVLPAKSFEGRVKGIAELELWRL